MSTMQKLREKRASIVSDMEAIVAAAENEGRDLTDEESELFASYQSDLDKVKADLGRREALEAEKADLQTPEPAATGGQGAGSPGRTAPEAKTAFESLGEFMHAVRFNPSDQRLEGADFEPQAADGQRTDSGAAGGFLIPQEFRDDLMRVDAQEAIIRPRARVIGPGDRPDASLTMPALDQTGSTPGNRYGGVEVNWIGEGDKKPDTEAEFREITLQPQELAGHIPVTDKFLRNWSAASSFLEQQLRAALIGAQDTAFLRGDGVAKPMGIIDAPATIKHSRASADEISYDDLVQMWAKAHGQGVWSVSRPTVEQLAKIEDPNGNYIWQPNARDGMAASIFGMPVIINERNPLLGSKGDVVLMDLSYYLIKDGAGPAVAMGYANDDFNKNRSRIKIFHNVDGKPWLTEPLKLENGHTVSPFVALDVPAG